MQYFGSNIVEGVAERWVEAEMSWVEVGTRFSNTLRRTLFLNDATALLHDKMYRYILHKSYLIMLH